VIIKGMEYFLFIAAAFISYCLGRLGHVFGGQINGPHHWLYGIPMIIVGIIFWKSIWGKILVAAGIGCMISDFNDMIQFKIYGVDDVEVKRFWGLD